MTDQEIETYIYRGRSLEELVPRIRTELGDDAVIVGRRETTVGGVGGFFARREIEVEVRPGADWERAADERAQAFAQQLAQAHERFEPPAAPVVRPATAPEIDALPGTADVTVDDLFPEPEPQATHRLAALFDAGRLPAEPAAPEDDDEPAAVEAQVEPELQEEEPEPELREEPEPEPEPVFVPAPLPELVVPALAPGTDGVALPPAAQVAVDGLVAHGLREGLAVAVAQEAVASLVPLLPDTELHVLVAEALVRRIPVAPLHRGAGALAFVGPGGTGKTRCVARLAAAHARTGRVPVTVVALHPTDGGAELRRLLAPYGVTLHAIESGAEGAATIAALRGDGLVLVDTPGVSPRAADELASLAAELRSLSPDEVHLTVSATIGPAAAQELVGGVRPLGVTALAVTHTDDTELLGTVVGLAMDAGLPLSYLTRGQAVDAGLRPAVARALAVELLP